MTAQPESKNGLVVTLNQMGYMNTEPEPYNQSFIDYAASCGGICLEIGAAYGLTAQVALEKGAKLIVNDLSQQHLDVLWARTAPHLRHNLTLLPGSFPQAFSLRQNSLHGVLCSRMLNFIPPQTLLEGFKLIFTWLKPGGHFFLLVSSPYMGNFRTFLAEYFDRKKNNHPWPGLLTDVPAYIPLRSLDLPPFMTLFDIEDLAPLLTEAGFLLKKIGYSPATPGHPDDMKADGREHVGAIALKPF